MAPGRTSIRELPPLAEPRISEYRKRASSKDAAYRAHGLGIVRCLTNEPFGVNGLLPTQCFFKSDSNQAADQNNKACEFDRISGILIFAMRDEM
jgi:hypothetical protein